MADFADFRSDTKAAGRALSEVAREAGDNAGNVVLEIVRDIYRAAKSNESSAPGTHPRSPSLVKLIPNREGGSVRVGGAPWARGAEYGAERAWVYGRVTLQRLLSRRTKAAWVRDPFGGYIVGKAWRDAARKAGDKAADGMLSEISSEFDQAGLRKASVGI